MPSEHIFHADRTKQKRFRRDPFERGPRSNNPAEANKDTSAVRILTGALFALPFAWLCGLILVSVMAGLAMTQADPAAMTMPLSLSVLGISSLVGGLITARRCGRSPLLCGLLFGAFFCVTLWVLSFVFGGRAENPLSLQFSFPISLLVRAAAIGLSVAGAYIGTRRAKRPTHIRKK